MNIPEPEFILRGHNSDVNIVKFYSLKNNLLLSGSSDGEIKLWNLNKRRIEQTFQHCSEEIIGGVIFIENLLNGNIVSQGRDGFLKIWNIENLINPLKILAIDSYSFCKCSILEQQLNKAIIAISKEEPEPIIEIWDLSNYQIIQKFYINNILKNNKLGLCMNIKLFSLNQENIVAACYENGGIYFWNLKTNTLMIESKLHNEPMLCFDLESSHLLGVSGSASNNICVFSINYEKFSITIQKEFLINHGGISSIKIRNDEKIFATAGWDHRIRIFDWKKLKPLAILKSHHGIIHTIDFSPFCNWLASGSKDKRISIYSIY